MVEINYYYFLYVDLFNNPRTIELSLSLHILSIMLSDLHHHRTTHSYDASFVDIHE